VITISLSSNECRTETAEARVAIFCEHWRRIWGSGDGSPLPPVDSRGAVGKTSESWTLDYMIDNLATNFCIEMLKKSHRVLKLRYR